MAKGQAKSFDQVLKLESLSEVNIDSGAKQIGEFSLSQPMAKRNAELLDAYFAKRLAALNVGENVGEGAAQEGVGVGMKRPELRRSSSKPSQGYAAKVPNPKWTKVKGRRAMGVFRCSSSQQPPSNRTLPLRAIKDD